MSSDLLEFLAAWGRYIPYLVALTSVIAIVLKPERLRYRLAWAFVILVITIPYLVYTEEISRGGDNPVFITVLFEGAISADTSVPLAIDNRGPFAVHDVQIEIFDRDKSLMDAKVIRVGTVLAHEHLRQINASIAPGDYAIDIRTRVEWFFERLACTRFG